LVGVVLSRCDGPGASFFGPPLLARGMEPWVIGGHEGPPRDGGGVPGQPAPFVLQRAGERKRRPGARHAECCRSCACLLQELAPAEKCAFRCGLVPLVCHFPPPSMS